MEETYRIEKLEQIRLLADPLKLQLLQCFAEGEHTTKEVAERLGERVTKLYRHVDALHDAGLLEVVQETQKRGTVERTFRAVARRFEAAEGLFRGGDGDEQSDAVRELLRAGEDEIMTAFEQIEEGEEEEFLMTRLRIKASPQRLAELREELASWLERIQEEACDAEQDGASLEEVGALVAFYPIKAKG